MLPDLSRTRASTSVSSSRCSSAAVVHLVFARTSFGTRLDVLGANARAAVHIGIDVPRLIVVAFLISGALIGLAAAIDIQGDLRLHARRLESRVRPRRRAARLPGAPERAGAHPVRGASSACSRSVACTPPARHACRADFVLLFMGILLLFMVGTQYLDRQARAGESIAPSALLEGRAVAERPARRAVPHDVVHHAGIVAGVPLLFASLGEIVAEQSGVLNVGLEGMMLAGALRRLRRRARDREPLAGPPRRRRRRRARLADHGRLLHPPGHGPDRRRHRDRARRRGRARACSTPAWFSRTFRGVPAVDGFAIPLLSDIPILGPQRLLAAAAGLRRAWRSSFVVSWVLRRTTDRPEPACRRASDRIRSMRRASASCACARCAELTAGTLAGDRRCLPRDRRRRRRSCRS